MVGDRVGRGGRDGATASRRRVAVEVLAVLAVALVVRWLGVDQEPLHDELYQFLAARSWLVDGDLTIVPGAEAYDRARSYTLLVAWVMGIFGQTLQVARMPAVLLGAAVPAAITWWLARNRLHGAALVAGGAIALDPQLIQLSQITRFYAAQNLAFLLGALAFAACLDRRRLDARLMVLGVAAVLLLTAAMGLQVITVVGMGGLVLYAVAWPRSWVRSGLARAFERHPIVSACGLVAVAGLGIYLFSVLGFIERATYADLWAEGSRYNLRFYYAHLHDRYASAVVLFPLLALLAWTRAPRVTWLALAVFGVAFVAHSLFAWKAERYLAYALPFFFVLASVGVVEGFHRLREVIPAWVGGAGGGVAAGSDGPGRGRVRAWITPALLGAALVAFALGNRSVLLTHRLLVRDPGASFPLMAPSGGGLSWSRAASELVDGAREASALVSTSPQKAIYFLDRLDYIVSFNLLHGPEGRREEFWVDPRFDRPVVSTAESLQRIRCDGSALVVVEEGIFRNSTLFPPGTARFLEEQGEAFPVPGGTGLAAFVLDEAPADDCGGGA